MTFTPKKQKRRPDCSFRRFCYSSSSPHRSAFLKRLAVLACTRSNCRILYSEVILRGTLSGQYPTPITLCRGVLTPGTIRFLLWWLFLHRRLRSRQRGFRPEGLQRHSTLWLIISSGRPSFLSERLRITFRFTLASLSASTPSVLDSGFPLLLSANGASPPPFHLLVPVKMPVSNLDCVCYLTLVIFNVK